MTETPNNLSTQYHIHRETHQNWHAYWLRERNPEFQNIHQLLTLVTQTGITLKDHPRSLVKTVTNNGATWVAKKPRDKNRRKWTRFLTALGRKSEVFSTFEGLINLEKKGIPSNQALAALEYKDKGKVIDSWLIYRFREGEPCSDNDAPKIINTLTDLHAAGMRFEDPNITNFMRDPQGRIFIIDCRGKASLGKVNEFYDLMHIQKLHKNLPILQNTITFDKQYPIAYFFAKSYHTFRELRQKIKRVSRRWKK